MKQFKLHLWGAAIMLSAGLITAGAGYFVGRAYGSSAVVARSPAFGAAIPVRSDSLGATVPGFRDAVERVAPSVVEVSVVDVVKQPANPFGFFFGPQGRQPNQQYRMQGLGSGVIVRQNGGTVYVLTNNHVAGDAEKIQVKLADGRQFDAKLVGKDPNKDLALVSFQAQGQFPVAQLGDSDALRPGDWVLAIGNPMGFESTVTAGIVSAVKRQGSPDAGKGGFTDYIQTDAPINQGNSGGPLVNTDGEVIGINTWIASPSGGSVGLGFAIPINNARQAIADFVAKGRVDYAWLGVTTGDVPDQTSSSLGLGSSKGAMVYGVFQGSPAQDAGLRPGDVVTKIDDRPVAGSSDLVRAVANMTPGTRATFALLRDGKPETLTVRLNSRVDEQKLAAAADKVWPGFAVMQPEQGTVVVVSVDQGGRADSVLQQGDVVTKINGSKVASLRDFYRLLNAADKGQVLLGVQREGNDVVVGLARG